MKFSFQETLIEVWRQAIVENAKSVELGAERFPVKRTPKHGLRQVDFLFDGNEIRGLEQNPNTKSRWAQLARSRNEVMQFLSEGRYVANDDWSCAEINYALTLENVKRFRNWLLETEPYPSRPQRAANASGERLISIRRKVAVSVQDTRNRGENGS